MVRWGPAIALLGQSVLLTTLAVTVEPGPVAIAAGAAYGVVLAGLLARAGTGFGPADWVTLTRAVLAGGITALVVDSFAHPVPVRVLVGLTVVALPLDWVDGQVARRTGTASALGARFDMEVDAFLILVLSVYVARSMGVWVLAMGLMRYAFVAAGWVLPWMRGTLPPRFWRKVVASVQSIALVVAAAGVLPDWLAVTAVAAALAMLVESFGRDVWWLWARASTVHSGPLRGGEGRAG